MIISPANILHLIASQRFVSQRYNFNIFSRVMETPIEVEVQPVTRKSRSMIVKFESERSQPISLFIKQPLDIYNTDQTFSIIREAFFYEACGRQGHLTDRLPDSRFFTFNRAYSILVRQWIKEVKTFKQLLDEIEKTLKYTKIEAHKVDKVKNYLDNIGWVLGHFHNELSKNHLSKKKPDLYKALESLKGGRPSFFLNIGSTNTLFLKLNAPQVTNFIDRYVSPQALKAIAGVNEKWETNHLIHSDLNANNVLVDPKTQIGQEKVYIIDWEYVVWGDISWDIASIIFHIILTDGINPIDKEAGERFQIFWKRYREGNPDLKDKVATCDFDPILEFSQKVMVYVGVKFYERAEQNSNKTSRRLDITDQEVSISLLLQKAEQFILGQYTQIFFPDAK